MKKNRYLPFGYHIQNGVLCIHEAEVAVVRQVFEDYQAGMSYRRIAESLQVAHSTVGDVIRRANGVGLGWPATVAL